MASVPGRLPTGLDPADFGPAVPLGGSGATTRYRATQSSAGGLPKGLNPEDFGPPIDTAPVRLDGSPVATDQLYSAMTRSRGISPDHVADVFKISRKTGLAVGTVERNLPEAKGLAELEPDRIEAFAQRNPKAAAWLSEPGNFGLAKDDLDTLGGLEQAFTRNNSTGPEPEEEGGVGSSLLKTAKRMIPTVGGSLYDMYGLGAGGLDYVERGLGNALGTGSTGVFGQARDWFLNQSNQIADNILSRPELSLPPSKQGRLWDNPRLLLDPEWLTFNVGDAANSMLPTIAGLFLSGGTTAVPAVIGAGQEAGNLYRDLITKDKADPDKALSASLAYGVVVSQLEKLGLDKIMDKRVAGTVAKRFAKAAVAGATEGGTEYLEEPFQAFFQGVANNESPEQVTARVGDALKNIDVIPGSFLLGGAGAYGNTAREYAKAKAAQRMGAAFDEIGKFSAGSKLNARLPEAYQDYVEHVRSATGGVVPEKVYVSAQRLAEAVVETGANGIDSSAQADAQVLARFFQSIGVKPEEASRMATLNQDVPIPFALYQSKIAPTEMGQSLANDIRFTPDGMTRNEAAQFEQEFQGRVQTELAAQEQNRAQNDADLAQAIGEYKGELARAGVKGKDADTTLQLLTAGANVAAARWSAIKGESVTPAQWLREMRGLQIRAVEQGQAQVGQQTLHQDHPAMAGVDRNDPAQVSDAQKQWAEKGVESPYFKRWFGDSKVVDEQGKPLIVAHGTNRDEDIDVFKQGHGRAVQSSSEYGPSRGMWFTGGGKAYAQDYGYNVSEHYLSIKNPVDLRSEHVLKAIEDSGILNKFGKNTAPILDSIRDGLLVDMGKKGNKIQNAVLKWAKESGYDGAITNDWHKGYDSTSYVAFDPTQIKSVFNRGTFDASDPRVLMQVQEKSGSRGSVTFTDRGTFISLFKGAANRSTLPHEFAHLFVNDMEAMAATGKAPESVTRDLETMRAFAGDLATVEAQEKLATAFEAYLREGKAPSTELRTAFQTFRAWLTAIYRDIRALLGPNDMNDELRGVFDRMLASEDEIAQAEDYYGAKNALEKVSADMLTDAEKKRIEELRGTSHADALEKRTRRYVSAYFKALGGKAEFERQAGEEVDAQPVYANIKDIAENGGLPRAALDELMGREQAQALFLKFPGLVSARSASLFGAHDLDLIAAAHDYRSADEMVADFQKATTRGEAVRGLTTAKMEAEEARLRGALANETVPGDEDVHSDGTLERLTLEALALERKIRTDAGAKAAVSRPINAAASREVARGVLEKMIIADARDYSRFAAAERRAGLAAMQAIKAQKWQEAMDAKQREAINHALVLEAVKLREEVARELSFAKRIGNSKSMRFDAKEQALSIIQTYGLGTERMVPERPGELADLASYLKAAFEGDLFNPFDAFPDWLLRKEKAGQYRDMAVNDFREVAYLMRSLADVGGSAAVHMATEDVSYEAKAGELAEVIRNSGNVATKYDEGTEKQKIVHTFRSVMSTLQQQLDMFRKADGYVNLGPEKSHLIGPNQEMFERIQKATKRMLGMQQALDPAMKEVAAVRQAFVDRFRKTYGERPAVLNGVDVPRIMQDNSRFTWTAERIWTLARNIGNGGNRRCLIEGLGLEWPQIQSLLRVLTKDELLAVQREGQIIGSHYAEADKTYRQVYNRPMAQRIEYLPMVVQAADGPVRLDGWYFPIKPDAKLNQRAGDRESADIMKADTASSAFPPNPRKSFTNARTGAAVPVALSFDVFERGIAEQTRFIALAPILKDADRVFRQEEYRRAYTDAFGREAYDEIRPWLKNIATPGMEQPDAYDDMLSKARRNATAFILIGNLKSALKQELGILPAMKEMGASWALRGVKALAIDGEMTVDAINAMDPRMKNREKGFDTEQRELLAKARNQTVKLAFGKIDTRMTERGVLNFGMTLQRLFDRHATYSVWAGAFLKGRDGLHMSEQEAADYAYRMVERTQVTNTDAAMNSLQRGKSWIRLFSMFMSEALPKGSRLRVDFNAFKNGKIGAGEYARTVFYELIGPVLFNVAGLNLLTSVPPDDPNDYFWSFWNELFGTVPLLSGVSGYFLYNQGPAESPVFTGMDVQLKAAQKAFRLTHDFENEDNQAALFKALIDVAAYKYNTGNVRKFYETAAEGFKDMAEGETKNPFRLVIRKPKERE